jgi:Predicted hydrolases or acyltransferases (alpha/beta hydrolase superfamily)
MTGASPPLRFYGTPPYRIAVLHGGPGALGSVAPLARKLGRSRGVLEPLQTALSVASQVEELHASLEEHASEGPVTLIGSSWGAMLAYIFAARHPERVRKAILVGSAVYEDRYAAEIQTTRLSRLSSEEQRELDGLTARLDGPDADAALARIGELSSKADTYDPLPPEKDTPPGDVRIDVYQRVWEDAARLRTSGALLELGRAIRCPVVAIHGDYDPHPAAGVFEPLSRVVADFRFVLLERCGHEPWKERQAHALFFALLEQELAD